MEDCRNFVNSKEILTIILVFLWMSMLITTILTIWPSCNVAETFNFNLKIIF